MLCLFQALGIRKLKKKKRFDIFKTFEIFNSEAASVIKESIIRFVLVEAENFFITKSCLKTNIMKDESVNFSIINNQKIYNLLSTVWKKYQKKDENEAFRNRNDINVRLLEELSRIKSA